MISARSTVTNVMFNIKSEFDVLKGSFSVAVKLKTAVVFA